MATYWEIAAHSAYDMLYKYKNLIVNFLFSHLGFWGGNFFLIVPFPDHCLLVPLYSKISLLFLFYFCIVFHFSSLGITAKLPLKKIIFNFTSW